MTEFIPTKTLVFENYKTEFFTEKNLKEFLMSESISCLSSRFRDSRNFYESILFKIPGTKKHKNYKMIYSHLILKLPEDFKTKKELAKIHKINEKEIIAEGSVALLDTSLEIKPQVRWLIIKN